MSRTRRESVGLVFIGATLLLSQPLLFAMVGWETYFFTALVAGPLGALLLAGGVWKMRNGAGWTSGFRSVSGWLQMILIGLSAWSGSLLTTSLLVHMMGLEAELITFWGFPELPLAATALLYLLGAAALVKSGPMWLSRRPTRARAVIEQVVIHGAAAIVAWLGGMFDSDPVILMASFYVALPLALLALIELPNWDREEPDAPLGSA